jgi:hypothetical protein
MFGVNEAPPSVLNEPQSCASFGTRRWRRSADPRSSHASHQTTARFPVVGLSEILTRNWVLVVVSSLIQPGPLQVAAVVGVAYVRGSGRSPACWARRLV